MSQFKDLEVLQQKRALYVMLQQIKSMGEAQNNTRSKFTYNETEHGDSSREERLTFNLRLSSKLELVYLEILERALLVIYLYPNLSYCSSVAPLP